MFGLGMRRHGYVGIDIGERAIKVAQLRRVGAGLELAAAAVAPRPASDEQLGEGLHAARTLAEGLRGDSVAALLSMTRCEVTPASDSTPEPDASRCRDAWGEPPNAYLIEVDRQEVDRTVDQLAKLRLRCEVLDGEPLAVARSLRLTPGYAANELIGALDWGDLGVTFVAAQAGAAIYTRRFMSGGVASLRDELQTTLGLRPEEADRALFRFGAASSGDAAEARVVGDTVRRVLRPVVAEARRTLEHLGGKLRRAGPSRIFVLGAGGAVPGLPDHLTNELHIETQAWTAPALRRADRVGDTPDCLLATAIATSALAWEVPA